MQLQVSPVQQHEETYKGDTSPISRSNFPRHHLSVKPGEVHCYFLLELVALFCPETKSRIALFVPWARACNLPASIRMLFPITLALEIVNFNRKNKL